MIDTHFYERLANWRRVYGDKPVRWRSPTDTFCRYAKCYFERAPETEEEKFWREVTELKGRDPLLPAPDYSDAELLQRAWMSLPERVDGTKVKRHIRVFVLARAESTSDCCVSLRSPTDRSRNGAGHSSRRSMTLSRELRTAK